MARGEVFRTDGPDGTAVAGLPDIYARTTGEDGAFVFEHSGLGGEPEAEQTWYLVVRHPTHLSRTETLTVPWVPGSGDDAPPGCVLRDVVLTLEPLPGPEPEAERTRVVWVDDLRLLEVGAGIVVSAGWTGGDERHAIDVSANSAAHAHPMQAFRGMDGRWHERSARARCPRTAGDRPLAPRWCACEVRPAAASAVRGSASAGRRRRMRGGKVGGSSSGSASSPRSSGPCRDGSNPK